MSRIIGCDSLGSFEIVVNFLSIEYVEDSLSSRMHKILIDIIHAIVNKYIPDSFCFVVFKFLFLLDEILKYLVVVFGLLVFMFEQECEDY
jgi:hypothetical protein